ncbi:MAG: oligopeptide/dipeptide ABC transporter ATP-binding protein, partial [Psychromonas sp.]
LEGELPSPMNPPSGCVFRTRCPISTARCSQEKPQLQGDERHSLACLLRS